MDPARRRRQAAAVGHRGRLTEPPLPAEQHVADHEDRQLRGALGQQSQPRALERAVAAQVARGLQALLEAQAGRGCGLGQRLWIVEVVAAAEGQAAGGEDERRRPAALRGQRRHAHRPGPGRRPRLGPHERHPQLRGAQLDRPARVLVALLRGEDVGDHGTPAHARELALDALGREVRPRREQVEVEAHPRAYRWRAGTRACRPSRGE